MSDPADLYELNLAIDRLHRELEVIARDDPERTNPRGREIVNEIHELEAAYKVLRDSIPRNYDGL